jgi:NAD(P)-dependent dehydrogenase (short-subunit alcohol dehydrogenase family)
VKLKPIDQQAVVVFGASSGIGRLAALRFAERGAKVVVAARGTAGLHTLVEEIRRAGGIAAPVTADAAQFAQVQALADEAARLFGRIDTWVHLPSVSVWGRFEDISPDEFAQIIQVNLLGQAYGAMAALPHLRRAGGGALIHVTSVEARRTFPLQSAYGASKHGVEGFLEALRVELMREGAPISVTNVMPAAINTPFYNKARTKLGVMPAPPPPIYAPEVVAEAIVHAAAHPVRDVYAGGAAKLLSLGQRLSPALMDAVLSRGIFFAVQRSRRPKGPDAPSNLFGPVEGYDRVEGDFGDHAFRRSIYTALELKPAAWRVLAAGLLGAALIVARRARK